MFVVWCMVGQKAIRRTSDETTEVAQMETFLIIALIIVVLLLISAWRTNRRFEKEITRLDTENEWYALRFKGFPKDVA